MAYTPDNAIALARKFVGDAPVTSMDATLCDSVNSIIWMAFPWQWAQAGLTSIALTDGLQDFAVVDTDIHKILRLRITRTDTTPVQHQDLGIREWLHPQLIAVSMWGMKSAAREPISGSIRLDSAIAIGSAETLVLQGEYWKTPTRITTSNMSEPLLIPDRHFPVFEEGLKWKLFQYIGDERAGGLQTNRHGGRSYTGQMGVFMDMLWSMSVSEDYGDDATESPDAPIGEASFW